MIITTQGKVLIGSLLLDAEIEMETKPTLSTEQKLEIGRMLRECVSDEGIEIVMESWFSPRYAAYIEYGKPPIDSTKIVEGSLVNE